MIEQGFKRPTLARGICLQSRPGPRSKTEHIFQRRAGRCRHRQGDGQGSPRRGLQAGRGDLREIPDRAGLSRRLRSRRGAAARRAARVTPAGSARRSPAASRVSSIVHCGKARPSGDIAEHHAHPRADADPLHHVGRRQLAVRRAQIADDAQRLVRRSARPSACRDRPAGPDRACARGRPAGSRGAPRCRSAPRPCPRPASTSIRASCTTGTRWSADSAAGRSRRRPADENRAPRSA